MKQRRKHYSSEEKVAILRRHLLEHVPVSDVCDELGLAPTVFSRWQKEFFENGAAAFERESKRQAKHESQQARIHAERDKKLEKARERRRELRQLNHTDAVA